jgi:hypothetical protein
VLGCDIYQKSKANRHAPYRLLKSLLTLGRAWSLIAIDFIVKLLPLKELMTGFVADSIMVSNCRLTKEAHFTPFTEALDVKALAYIFLKVIVIAYGFLDEIISDRDKLFTSKF